MKAGTCLDQQKIHVRHDLYADLIDDFVRRRRKLGLSQEAVNDRIGCADGLVGKWECGIRTPTPRSFAEWSRALGVRLELVPVP
ncbi:MAG: helix-turn-helix transcriptional regulator [Rhodospirillales bacterium]|nr:helix-turn-helix transcriptional regulator [Rhodospirillales bacterium]